MNSSRSVTMTCVARFACCSMTPSSPSNRPAQRRWLRPSGRSETRWVGRRVGIVVCGSCIDAEGYGALLARGGS